MDNVTDAFERKEKAEAELAQAKRVLDAAERSGDIDRVKKAVTHLEEVQVSLEKANEALRVLRGDYLKEELVTRMRDGIDLSLLATPDELVRAFGSFTQMNTNWFRRLADKPRLAKARKIRGAAKKGASAPPYFCPLEVIAWLASSSRRVGTPISEQKAWQLLEKNFPAVYEKNKGIDPR